MIRDPTRLSIRARWLGAWCALATAVTGRHVYLSTGCLHGDHGYCAGTVGVAGRKRPATCKKCVAGGCRCSCHR